MAKEISGYVKLQIKGGAANPAPRREEALSDFRENSQNTGYSREISQNYSVF